MKTTDDGIIRKFETGATRDTSTNKNDYEGFLSPLVIEAFGDYMNENRKQTDGSLRDSDNWQKGIPKTVYMKSAFRHFFQWWKIHRGLTARDEKGNVVDLKHAIGGLLFNVMGYMHESLITREMIVPPPTTIEPPPPPPKPEYPRFFFRQRHRSIFILASEKIGLACYLDNSPTPWGNANWRLDEMEAIGVIWSEDAPVEITREKATELGLPHWSKWPAELYYGYPAPEKASPLNE